MTEKDTPNYYAIIPAPIRYDKNLSPNTKLLYGEISALANKYGYCYASNEYFAQLYEVSKTTISAWISQLVEFEYVRTEIEFNYKRKIYILPLREIQKPPSEKAETPLREIQKPPSEKAEESIIYNNTLELKQENNVQKKSKQPKPSSDLPLTQRQITDFFTTKLNGHAHKIVWKEQVKAVSSLRSLSMSDLEGYFAAAKNDPFYNKSEITPRKLLSAISNGLKIEKIESDFYQKKGFKNREEYLSSLRGENEKRASFTS